MVQVHFTSHLEVFFKDLKTLSLECSNVNDAISQINQIYPGIKSYLLDEQGCLRKHVKIYINEDFIIDEVGLTDKLKPTDHLYFMQALSGG